MKSPRSQFFDLEILIFASENKTKKTSNGCLLNSRFRQVAYNSNTSFFAGVFKEAQRSASSVRRDTFSAPVNGFPLSLTNFDIR